MSDMTSSHPIRQAQDDGHQAQDDGPGRGETGYRVERPPGRQVRPGSGSALTWPPRPGPPSWPAGIGSVIVGVILLAWPKETLTVVAVLIGAALIVAGLLRLVDGFTAHESSGGRRVASVVIGLIAIVLGLYCMRHFHVTIAALAIIVGLFWVIHGIADIGIGLFASGGPAGHGLTVLAGVLSLCAGLIVLFWPTISLTVLVAVIGIWLIVYGILAAFLAFRLRRGGSAPPGPGDLAAT